MLANARRRWVPRIGAVVRFRELSVNVAELRESKAADIAGLSEVCTAKRNRALDSAVQVLQEEKFLSKLGSGSCVKPYSDNPLTLEAVGMSKSELMTNVKAAFATNVVHTESRIMSLLGQVKAISHPSLFSPSFCCRDFTPSVTVCVYTMGCMYACVRDID
jgi:hypothetical protein